MCEAAVQNGADAIYAGAPNFNARRHGTSISIGELKRIAHYCRLYGVKFYIACNVLIFENELDSFAEAALPWLELVPDAAIVQDIGLARWLRKAAPWLPLHASTQMTIASSGAVRLAREMGFSRCILARELSIEQIREIHADCPEMELEAFAHGALCVSYSGQCNASLGFGGRSANRGDCAQCCRLPYEIFADGKSRGKSYAFSPSDLCAIPLLGELMESGVSSLKIEGRLKSAEYAASATAAYRKAIDQRAGKSEGFDDGKALETIFSRGFASGWLKQGEAQTAVSGRSSGHIGFLLGQIARAKGNKIWVKTKKQCKAGEGIAIASEGCEPGRQLGGRVYSAEQSGDLLCLSFAKDKDFSQAAPGSKAYINSSPSAGKAIAASPRKIPVSAELSGRAGEPLTLKINSIEIKSSHALEKSSSSALHSRPLAAIIPGNSHYICESPAISIHPDAFVNDKMVRQLRQKALAALDKERTHREFPGINPVDISASRAWQAKESPGDIVLDFLGIGDLQAGIELARQMGLKAGAATWQVHHNSDAKFLAMLAELKPDFILVRSLGAFEFLRNSGIELRGDSSLNVCNRAAAEYFLENGMASIRPSLDCGGKSPIIPAFHSKHCLFSAAFSGGKTFPKCGSPCKFHHLEAEDRKGKRHLILADGGCRNTMFNKR